MKINMKWMALGLILLTSSSCLRTRAEVGEVDQTAVYSKKAAENQLDGPLANTTSGVAANSPAVMTQTQIVEDKDELIRNLNGRVEVLENQLASLQKTHEEEKQLASEKMNLLQEALTKLQKQVNGEDVVTDVKSSDTTVATGGFASSDEIESKIDAKMTVRPDPKAPTTTEVPKGNSYEVGQSHFDKKEWKKAILSFHKYTDDAPKSKLIPDAKYKIGISFQELGMKEEAMAYFEEVVANYGATDAGKKAKSRLTKLKK